VNTIEEDMKTAGVCVEDVIGPNGGLERRWPTPNKWDKGEGDDGDDDERYLPFFFPRYWQYPRWPGKPEGNTSDQ